MSGSCDTTRLSLGAYALGSLEPDDHDLVAAHLQTCPTCLVELAELESVVPRLAVLTARDVFAPAPSEDLFARITQAVDSAETDQPAATARRRLSTRWVIAVAASVIVLLGAGAAVGFATFSSSPATTSTASATAGGVRLHVTAADAASGTRLVLTAQGLPRNEHCRLVAQAADGTEHDAGTWDATYDGEARVTESTVVPRSQLRRLTLYGNDGQLLVVVTLASR